MDEVLKRCPFCRREAILDGERGCWAVFCPSTNHEAATRHFVSKAEAIAAWNTRADAARGDPVARVVEWLQSGAMDPHNPIMRRIGENLAAAIERGEPFNAAPDT